MGEKTFQEKLDHVITVGQAGTACSFKYIIKMLEQEGASKDYIILNIKAQINELLKNMHWVYEQFEEKVAKGEIKISRGSVKQNEDGDIINFIDSESNDKD